MRVAFIILAHNDPDNLLRLIGRLAGGGDAVIVHWDLKNPLDFAGLAAERLPAEVMADVRFCPRLAVAWGRWSMVEATLAALAEVERLPADISHVLLLSGADYPLRPVAELKAFLARHPEREFIECVDPDQNPWVVQGLVKERFLHHHWFCWRRHRPLFDWSLATQKKLGIKRRLPNGLKPYFGSQWWALRRSTAQKVLALSRQPAIRRFFKTTWVPDEMFFQTLVAAVAPPESLHGSSLTFYHFDHTGKPLTFYNDHHEFLRKQQFFFARKLSPHARRLRDLLDAQAAQPGQPGIGALAKHTDDYQQFMAVQWRGIPGKRVVGRQLNAWHGDLEWNLSPYFVIFAYPKARLQPLVNGLNALPGLRCFGQLFAGRTIDYGAPEWAHPFYPPGQPALRDMKRPNFLVDLIQANPKHIVGFIARLPTGNDMERVVLYDKRSTVVFVLPEDLPWEDGAGRLDWSGPFQDMILYDHLDEARKAGKPFLCVKTNGHILGHSAIELIKGRLLELRDGHKAGDDDFY